VTKHKAVYGLKIRKGDRSAALIIASEDPGVVFGRVPGGDAIDETVLEFAGAKFEPLLGTADTFRLNGRRVDAGSIELRGD
jgi:hypothetical protein